ncbi:hypothetical protein VNO78_09254 [Psophocarpus tetragonolobus]|uniref:Uncharacterized protein n=1 Tax=Psophocarpus tetragonolobus TaxID=3891 RepID=A0AAN9SW19_PSOTE
MSGMNSHKDSADEKDIEQFLTMNAHMQSVAEFVPNLLNSRPMRKRCSQLFQPNPTLYLDLDYSCYQHSQIVQKPCLCKTSKTTLAWKSTSTSPKPTLENETRLFQFLSYPTIFFTLD